MLTDPTTPAGGNPATPKYRPDIDGLRAIAVLIVVAFHAFPRSIPGGFIGVDVFFVISGFLISTIIFEDLRRGHFSFRAFYSRRIKRIFPALALVLATLYAAGWFLLLADEFRQLGKHILGGATFISNLVLWREVGYFDTRADTKPLLHLWSLGIEEQFYIAYPIIIFIVGRARFGIPAFLCIAGATSLLANIAATPGDPSEAFYSPFTRFWELLLGAVLAYRRLDSSPGTQTGFGAASLAGLCGIAMGALALDPSMPYPGWNALLPAIGSALCIAAPSGSLINGRIIGNKALVAIGLISYPLYLWHWPLLSMSHILGFRSICARIVAVAASFILATLTYQFLEKPIRFNLKNRYTPAALVIVLCAIAITGLLTHQGDGLVWRSANSQFGQNAAELADTPSKLTSYPCPLELQNASIDPVSCRTSIQKPPKFALFGDSHAADKFFGFAKTDPANSWLLIGNSSCAPVIGINVTVDQPGCRKKSDLVIDYLTKTRSIETVVFSFYGGYPLDTAFAADHLHGNSGPPATKIDSEAYPGKSKAELFLIGLDNAISAVESAGKQAIVIIDVPELPFFPRDCLRNSGGCELATTTVRERQTILREIVKKLQSRHPRLMVYDPLTLFCGENRCNYMIEGTLVYQDSHHLSAAGSVYFALAFKSWLVRH